MKKIFLLLTLLSVLTFGQTAEEVEQLKQEVIEDPAWSNRNNFEKLIKDTEYDNAKNNYILAVASIKDGGSYAKCVKRYIDKAISLDSTKLQFYSIRARCNMTSKSSTKDLEQAVNDFNYIIEQGKNTAEISGYLGLAYSELARKWRYLYTDTTEEQIINLEKALNYNQKAIESFKNAIEIDAEYEEDLKYKIKDCERKIADIKQELGE